VRAQRVSLMRDRAGPQRVTNVELFYDLVFVFAVTQLSHFLLAGDSAEDHAGTAFRAALLLTMIWLVWVYTTWVTNWLDPDRLPVRLLLLVLAILSLVPSAALPTAFAGSGWIVGSAYLVVQVGRSAFTVLAIDDPALRRNFQRILAWCVVSGLLALAGGLVGGDARVALWVAAVAVDLTGGAVGFYTPGLGRSRTAEWTIEGGHFAERCQGFILIAIGESIVIIGAALAARLGSGHPLTGAEIATFAIAAVGSLAFWWVYFDRAAGEAAAVIAASTDPGRLGRSAYHLIHPIMVAGIIVAAAADGAVANLASRGRAGAQRAGLGGRADPRRPRALPDRPRGVQGRDLATGLLAPGRRGCRSRAARPAGPACAGAGPRRVRRRRGRRGRRGRPGLAAGVRARSVGCGRSGELGRLGGLGWLGWLGSLLGPG
jgi:low temperature requirement protein LtrA